MQGVSPGSRIVLTSLREGAIACRYGSSRFRCTTRALFEQELNDFLASHKVVSIDRHLIDQGINSFWAICVDYLRHVLGETNRNPNLLCNRIDYKTVLPPEEFEVFALAAQWRRTWPRSKPYRSTRCLPTSNWRKWFNDDAIPSDLRN